MEQDGETEIVLGQMTEVDPGGRPAFDGTLETPHQKVIVSGVDQEILLESIVSGTRTRVRIWVGDSTEPDLVVVGLE